MKTAKNRSEATTNKIKIYKDFAGWEYIKSKDFVELWKTPTMYLVCIHYLYKFKFCRTFQEAESELEKMFEANLHSNL